VPLADRYRIEREIGAGGMAVVVGPRPEGKEEAPAAGEVKPAA